MERRKKKKEKGWTILISGQPTFVKWVNTASSSVTGFITNNKNIAKIIRELNQGNKESSRN